MAVRLLDSEDGQGYVDIDDNDDNNGDILLKKQQYVVNHIICQTESPVLAANCI
jgi:hypothetical protein